MSKPFDPTKPVQTRDGRKARIICTDRKNPTYPIIALVEIGGIEQLNTFEASGSFRSSTSSTADLDLVNIPERHSTSSTSSTADLDLVNIPERRSKFLNIYADNSFGSRRYNSLHDARHAAVSTPLAIIEFIYEDDRVVDVILHKGSA